VGLHRFSLPFKAIKDEASRRNFGAIESFLNDLLKLNVVKVSDERISDEQRAKMQAAADEATAKAIAATNELIKAAYEAAAQRATEAINNAALTAAELAIEAQGTAIHIAAADAAERAAAAESAAIAAAGNYTDGKRVVFWQDNKPPLTGRSEGDTWFDTDNGMKPYRWDTTVSGSDKWVAQPLGSAAIGSLDVGKLVGSEIVGKTIKTGAAGSQRIELNTVGNGTLGFYGGTTNDLPAASIVPYCTPNANPALESQGVLTVVNRSIDGTARINNIVWGKAATSKSLLTATEFGGAAELLTSKADGSLLTGFRATVAASSGIRMNTILGDATADGNLDVAGMATVGTLKVGSTTLNAPAIAADIADTGWVTTGITTANSSYWTVNAQKYRKIGSIVSIYVQITRGTSTLTIPADGNIADTPVLNIPAAITPTAFQGLHSGTVGRLAAFSVRADGTIDLSSLAGGANLAVGDSLSVAGTYFV
jgi:hypothetical protein